VKETLNAIKEERDALQRDKDKSLGLEGRLKMSLGEKSEIEKALSILTKERDNLSSKIEEGDIKFDELSRECFTLKKDLDTMRDERDALQRGTHMLGDLELKMKKALEEKSSFQKTQLRLILEIDTLELQRDELENNLDELKRQCLALQENLNAAREEHDDLRKDRDKSVGLEVRLKTILDEKSSNQKALSMVTKERENLSSKLEEEKIKFDELSREWLMLKKDLDAMRDERDALQRGIYMLGGLEGRLKMISDEKSSIQKAHFVMTQERDNLRSKLEEQKIKFDELYRECHGVKETLNAIKEERDALQRDIDKSAGLKGRMKETSCEKSCIKNAHLFLVQERDSLRAERDELRRNLDELKRECLALKENLNSIREERDDLQRGVDELLGLEGRMNMMKSIKQKANVIVTQEGNTLRSEHNEVEDNFDRILSKLRALRGNINAMREECNELQMNNTKLVDLAGRRGVLDKLSKILRDHMLLTQEKDSLRYEHEKVNVKFDKLERKCSSLKRTLNAIREKCGALHWDKDELVRLQAIFLMMLDGESSTEKIQMRATPEKDRLKSAYNKLKASYEKLERQYSSLTEGLSAIREERDALQRNEDKLVGAEGRMSMMLDEHLGIQNTHFLLYEERGTLRSDQGTECRCWWT
jgi:chromosome segregation ATPase